MKYISLFFMLLTILSCTSSNKLAGGTVLISQTDEIINNKILVSEIKKISSKLNNSNPTIIWRVGTFIEKGVRFSFPGTDVVTNNKNILFSEIDFNKDRFKYFAKKNINIILLIEPGKLSSVQLITNILNYYSTFDNIIGVCIDYGSTLGEKPSLDEIIRILKIMSGINENYILILKHWDLNSLPVIYNKQLMYLFSNNSSNSLEDFTRSSYVWYKKYYPSNIGIEITNYSLLENYKIKDIKKSFKDIGMLDYSAFFIKEVFNIIQ